MVLVTRWKGEAPDPSRDINEIYPAKQILKNGKYRNMLDQHSGKTHPLHLQIFVRTSNEISLRDEGHQQYLCRRVFVNSITGESWRNEPESRVITYDGPGCWNVRNLSSGFLTVSSARSSCITDSSSVNVSKKSSIAALS